MLVGLALMQLGTTQDTFLTIVSLLSLLSGFEIIYAALELSTLLTGLLAIVNLGLSLVGSTSSSKSTKKLPSFKARRTSNDPQHPILWVILPLGIALVALAAYNRKNSAFC